MPSTRDTLVTARKSKRCVSLARARLKAAPVLGVPLVVSATLVLLRQVQGLAFDGFTILRVADITAVIAGEPERFTERVLRGEGAMSHLRQSWLEVPITDWESVLSALRQRPAFLTVSTERPRAPEQRIGSIIGLGTAAVGLQAVDDAGAWGRRPETIAFKQISRVTYGTRHARLLRRYAPRRPTI